MSINFDFIIVGGGSSGSVLASELASKGPTLLIERGTNNTAYPQSKRRQGWPQISVIATKQSKNHGSGHWLGTPEILGGGSALNAGVCWRGQMSIFDSLGFEHKDVEKTFKHLEERLCVSNEEVNNTFLQAFSEAWEELGYTLMNNASLSGTTWTQHQNASRTVRLARTVLPTQDTRRPASQLFDTPFSYSDEQMLISNEDYEQPSILSQGNLTVFLSTTAKRIIFNGEVAVGINISSPAGDASVYVRKGGKIFLSAGTLETPKLLMLSGIGPSATLSKYNITPIHINDAVGQDLIDRKEYSALIPVLKELEGDSVALLDIAAFNEDTWASTSNKFVPSWANALAGCRACDPIDRTPACFEQFLGALTFYGSGSIPLNFVPYNVFQRHPLTTGFVTLNSEDFRDQPLVNDGWDVDYDKLTPDALRDLKIITDGVEELIIGMLANSTLLENLGYDAGRDKEGPFDDALVGVLSEGRNFFVSSANSLNQCKFSSSFYDDSFCGNWDECVPTIPPLPFKNREELERLVFKGLASAYHVSGTCKADAVVERKSLSVIGVKGLHVCDLSVITQPVDTYSMLTAMAIGHLVGSSTGNVPTSQYEKIPVILGILCISIVIFVVVSSLLNHYYHLIKRQYDPQPIQQEEGGNDVTVLDVWGINNNDSEKARQTQKLRIRENTLSSKPEGYADSTNSHASTSSLIHDNKDPSSYLMKWSNVSCTYQKKKKKLHSDCVTTLFESYGYMKEGDVTAIMGPSGAAKSTLLDILAGRKSVGDIYGNFSILGKSLNIAKNKGGGVLRLSKAIEGISAYIPQQEYFYPTQTCKEAIEFTLNMKFGRGDFHEQEHVIKACLDVVGLDSESYASRKIGGELAGGVSVRGLSGGERKRLALACVLALRPKMLFVDELTSGLDSENAYLIMKLLKDLSVKLHVATLIIIHQPSPEIFELFDRLILLSKGRCIFSGDCSNLPTFYETNFGEKMPEKSAIANDLIIKASSYHLTTVDRERSFNKGDDKNYLGSLQTPDVNTCETDVESNRYMSSDSIGQRDDLLTCAGHTFFKLSILFRRNLLNQYVRNITNVVARLLSYSGLAAIIGMVFWRVGATDSNAGLTYQEANILLRANLFLMNVSYLLPFSTIPVFYADKKFLAAESALGLYPTWMYGISQVFLEFIFLILTATVEAAIVIPMCALINPVISESINFFTITSILIMSGLVGSTIILCCSIWLPTQDLSFLVGSTIVTISLSLCGGFLPYTSMPDVPHALQWLSPIKYSYQAMALALLNGTSAEKVIDLAGYNTPGSITENVYILGGIFLVLAILSAIGMTRVKEVR